MTTPVERNGAPTTVSYRADAEFDALMPSVGDEADGVYTEITERRAQLENADILRGARAL